MSLENNLQASQHVTEGTFDACETLRGNFRYKKNLTEAQPQPLAISLFLSFLFSAERLG